MGPFQPEQKLADAVRRRASSAELNKWFGALLETELLHEPVDAAQTVGNLVTTAEVELKTT